MADKIESIPEARLLLASLRSVGYNEETAIADIVDNCISAQAHKINIQFDWEKKRIVIADDGLGMSEKNLIENMRIGSSDPSKIRSKDDLGRFGMGMKTAAFSLGKRLTVVTKSNFAVSNASWDLDQIPEIGWNLIIRDESEISEFSSQMGEQGTIVIIEDLDRVIDIDDEKKAKNKFYRIASKTEKHLALTFHRFIEEDNLILELNGTPIKAWNPFILENSATQELPEESIFSDNGCAEVTIQPYVLPHKTKFATDDDYQVAGGPKGWNYHQGIYVYRNRRLIICGTWFDYIKRKNPHTIWPALRLILHQTVMRTGKLILRSQPLLCPVMLGNQLKERLIFVLKLQLVYTIHVVVTRSLMSVLPIWIMYGSNEKRMVDIRFILTENILC